MKCKNCNTDISNGKRLSLCLIDERESRLGIQCSSCFYITEKGSMTHDAVLAEVRAMKKPLRLIKNVLKNIYPQTSGMKLQYFYPLMVADWQKIFCGKKVSEHFS